MASLSDSERVAAGGSPAQNRCSQCGSPNPASRKFCAGCGTALWEPCVSCGNLSMAGEKFCGACGVNLVEALQERLGKTERHLSHAAQLQNKHRLMLRTA